MNQINKHVAQPVTKSLDQPVKAATRPTRLRCHPLLKSPVEQKNTTISQAPKSLENLSSRNWSNLKFKIWIFHIICNIYVCIIYNIIYILRVYMTHILHIISYIYFHPAWRHFRVESIHFSCLERFFTVFWVLISRTIKHIAKVPMYPHVPSQSDNMLVDEPALSYLKAINNFMRQQCNGFSKQNDVAAVAHMCCIDQLDAQQIQ